MPSTREPPPHSGKPVVITFDPSTKCGVGVGPIGGKPSLSSHKLGDERDTVEVFGRAAALVQRLAGEHRPVLIAVEQPFYKAGESNYSATQVLHGLYGAITGAAHALGILVWPVAVQTWRATALGTAKLGGRDAAKKAMMQLCAALGWPAVDDNAADAGGIWMWATATYAPYGVVPGDGR